MDIKKTSLHADHLKLNAKMAPFAGFDMPIQYASVKDEVLAIRQKAGMFDVSHMGEFFVEGPEAIDFVDYLIPNEFKAAAENKAVYAPLCRENGTVVDDLIAYKVNGQTVLICVNASNMAKDWTWIHPHADKFKCRVKNVSDDFSLIAIQGPQADAVCQKIGLIDKSEFSYFSVKTFKYANEEIIVARTGYTGEDGFELFCSHSMAQTLWNQFLNEKVVPCGLASRDVLRLEVCYPLYGHELNDEITPLDAGLAWTVKLNKPRFIGKEALQNYTPHFQQVKLTLDKGVPRAEYPITNRQNEQIGRITSGTMSPILNKGIALGLVEKSKMPQDKKFSITIRDKGHEANYQSKPFIVGGHK
ncbi:MAG: glycine cleavage system aminomethyltransferase GcvT [Pseudomonadota bacterium]